MTQGEKKVILDDWWKTNHNQLKINVWKCLGYSQAAHNKWGDDLLAWSYEQFTKKPIDKQYEIYEGGKLEHYITRGFALAIKSNTSPFFHQYRKFNSRSAQVNTQSDYQGKAIYIPKEYSKLEDKEQLVRDAVATLDFYDRHIVTQYYYGGESVLAMAKKLDINPSTLSKDIKKALVKLKMVIKDDIEL